MIPHCVNTDVRIVSSGKRWGHGRQNAMAGFAEYATFQPKGMTRFETAEAPPAEHRTFERGTRIEPDASRPVDLISVWNMLGAEWYELS